MVRTAVVMVPHSKRAIGLFAAHGLQLFVAFFPLQLGPYGMMAFSARRATSGASQSLPKRRTRSACGRCEATGRRRCAPVNRSAVAGAAAHESAPQRTTRDRRRGSRRLARGRARVDKQAALEQLEHDHEDLRRVDYLQHFGEVDAQIVLHVNNSRSVGGGGKRERLDELQVGEVGPV